MNLNEFTHLIPGEMIMAYGKKYTVKHKNSTTVDVVSNKDGKEKTFYIYEIEKI